VRLVRLHLRDNHVGQVAGKRESVLGGKSSLSVAEAMRISLGDSRKLVALLRFRRFRFRFGFEDTIECRAGTSHQPSVRSP
jgi:hypothetical protein